MTSRRTCRRGTIYFVILAVISVLWLFSLFHAHRRAQTFAKSRPLDRSARPSQRTSQSVVKAITESTTQPDVSSDVLAFFNRMSLEQQVGQLLMVSVKAVQLTKFVQDFLGEVMPGGLILCPYNVAPGVSVSQFIGDLQRIARNVTPVGMFVAADQEGGRRLRDPLGDRQQVTHFPSQMAVGVLDSPDVAYRVGRTLGGQLRRLGVNMNLAPVLDVNNNLANPIINMRAFSNSPHIVGQLGKAYVRGLQAAGCLAVGKHFPGHGDTSKDSHRELPVVNRTLAQLRRLELAPFQAAFSVRLAAVMSAHITYPSVLPNGLPATLSHRFLTDVLRDDMGFRGLALTDDMKMEAIKVPPGEAAVLSVLAGADIVLSTSSATAARQMYHSLLQAVDNGRIDRDRLRASVLRILSAKEQVGLLQPSQNYTMDSETSSLVTSANELNANISQSAIIFSGPPQLLTPPVTTRRIFILYHDQLRHLVTTGLKDGNDVVLRDLSGLHSSQDPAWAQSGAVVYIYFLLLEPGPLSMLRALATRRGLHIVALCSGNPFQFHSHTNHLFDAALLSLSNTPASILAMALALSGRLLPRSPNISNAPLTLPGRP